MWIKILQVYFSDFIELTLKWSYQALCRVMIRPLLSLLKCSNFKFKVHVFKNRELTHPHHFVNDRNCLVNIH